MKMFGNKWKQDIEENEPYWDLCFCFLLCFFYINFNNNNNYIYRLIKEAHIIYKMFFFKKKNVYKTTNAKRI
jgi:hypothetical protein